MSMTIGSYGKTKQIDLIPSPDSYYQTIKIRKQQKATEAQKLNFEMWSENKF
jgi:hypothetical protein